MKIRTLISMLLGARREVKKSVDSGYFPCDDGCINVLVKDTTGKFRHIKSVKMKESSYYCGRPHIVITLSSTK